MTDRINKPVDTDKSKALDELKKFSDEQMEKHGPQHWILNESGEVIPASLMEWTFWFENHHQRVIQQDYIEEHMVSTIFEGIDIRVLSQNQRPRVFETMVFGPPEETKWFNDETRMLRPSLWSERSFTLKQALEVHQTGIQWLQFHLKEIPK